MTFLKYPRNSLRSDSPNRKWISGVLLVTTSILWYLLLSVRHSGRRDDRERALVEPMPIQTVRNLHSMPFEHSHLWQQQTMTQTPTRGFSAQDDVYYTDDGAIVADMVRDKKELYERERLNPNNNNIDADIGPEVSALEGTPSGGPLERPWLVTGGIAIVTAASVYGVY